MPQKTKQEKPSRLDASKLLGFRNLVPVTPADREQRASAAEAFNKVGTPSGETLS